MSIANLITTGSKSYQDIDVDTLTCKDCICETNTIDELYTQNIYADPPATEIDCHNTFNMLGNDLINVGTLDATNIIGNISDDIIDVNQINPKDNPDISITGDLDLNNNDIINMALVNFQTQPATDNSNTNLLTVDAVSGDVEIRTVASLPVGNPFNQSLNTTDDVTFNSITATGGIVDAQAGLQNTSGVLVDIFGGLDLNNNLINDVGILNFETIPFNDNTTTQELYVDTTSGNVVSRVADYTTKSFYYDLRFSSLAIGVTQKADSVLNLPTIPAYVCSAVDTVTNIGRATLITNSLYNISVHFGKFTGLGMNENNQFLIKCGSVNSNNNFAYIANCDVAVYTNVANYQTEINPKSFIIDTAGITDIDFEVTPLTTGSTSLSANSFEYQMFVRITRIC